MTIQHRHRVAAAARRKRAHKQREMWHDMPYVCPGCFAVAEPCHPGCREDELFRSDDHEDPCADDWEFAEP